MAPLRACPVRRVSSRTCLGSNSARAVLQAPSTVQPVKTSASSVLPDALTTLLVDQSVTFVPLDDSRLVLRIRSLVCPMSIDIRTHGACSCSETEHHQQYTMSGMPHRHLHRCERLAGVSSLQGRILRWRAWLDGLYPVRSRFGSEFDRTGVLRPLFGGPIH